MIDSKDFLVEIGTEELPPKALPTLIKSFAQEIQRGLDSAELSFAEVHEYAAPRRLAVWVEGVATRQADKQIERRGPAVAAAFDAEGNPSKAAQGFARSCGVEVDQLARMETAKGSWLCFRAEQKGASATDLLPEIVSNALAKLPIPKRMRWGSRDTEFVRPVHWVILLQDSQVIPAQVMGITADNKTRGHRFHHPEALEISQPARYAEQLKDEGYVIADFSERRATIRHQVETLATAQGGTAVIDAALLDEVTALVEWPVALAGKFDEAFLDVPHEALIATMQDNQKYFPLVSASGGLMARFITVANIESSDPETVIEGNERVIRPRFSDAVFFWEQDRKQTLASRVEALKTVLFQKQLGTLYDKTLRIQQLAAFVATQIGADQVDAERAAWLSKCDLLSDMVNEFPKLQGIAGRYYAQHDGEAEAVALALDEQYLPRHAGDDLPAGGIAQALAIADKIDTVVGIFGIGQKPSGTRDPFGLRRASLGILRILIEKDLDLDLKALIEKARSELGDRIEDPDVVIHCFEYVQERLKAYYQDRGVEVDVIDAVMAQQPARPVDFDRRVLAVMAFKQLPEAESLAAANKRIQNILRKADGDVADKVDPGLFDADAEQALYTQLESMESQASALFDQARYEEALTLLAGLRGSVDQFFDEVMVMADDEALKRNRLALLARLSQLFLRAGDLSRLRH